MGGLIPRLRQVCSREPLGALPDADGGRSRLWKAPPNLDETMHSARSAAIAQAEDDLVMNHVVLTGLIAADPQRDKSRQGEPVTVLLVSFPAPDEESGGTACCEVEVPDELADRHRKDLRAGAPILISGAMTGASGIWAKMLAVGEAP